MHPYADERPNLYGVFAKSAFLSCSICAISRHMNPISAFAIFFIIWWVTLFAMLSVGLKTQGEAGEVVPGTMESAPARPRFLLVIGLTTLVACIIYASFYWFAVTKGLRFDNLSEFLPDFMKVPLNVAK